MYADSHVHCRGGRQSYKGETIPHALEVAKDSRLSGLFDMPNKNPAITTKKQIKGQLKIAEKVNSPVFYGAFMELIPDKYQIKEAVETHKEFFPRKSSDRIGVIGFKIFLDNKKPEEILEIYRGLSYFGYEGVTANHCEKKSEIRNELWDPSKPVSHSYVRPEKSETESINEVIDIAKETNYRGSLHVVHVSTPESVDIVNDAKKYLRISSGVTFNHLLLDIGMLKEYIDQIMDKVNPPLRSPETREKLFKKFANGEIDILESDHAPHSYRDKFKRYASGIPSLSPWPLALDILRKKGIKESLIEKVAYKNVNEIFGTKIPRIDFPIKSHDGEYLFNPYDRLK